MRKLTGDGEKPSVWAGVHRRITRPIGWLLLLAGCTIWGGLALMAWLRVLVGGEVREYTKMMAEAREQAIDRMEKEARSLGANGIVAVGFTTSMIMSGAAEIMCYGTTPAGPGPLPSAGPAAATARS